MGTVTVKIYPEPELERAEILRYIGVKSPTDELRALIEESIDEALPGISYKVCYAEFPIKQSGACIDLGFTETSSRSLRRVLSGCDSVVLFAATLGVGADRLIMRYSGRNRAKALALDGLFTERIEALCDAFCREVAKEKSKDGFEITDRFSAGYGDFPLEVQRDIFTHLLPQKNIGVCLNSSLLMTPTKSVTAVIGIKKRNG